MTDKEVVKKVAEKVMGWRLLGAAWPQPKVGWRSAYVDKADYDDWFKNGTVIPRTKHRVLFEDFNPLKDANQCLRVMDKMRERGWDICTAETSDHDPAFRIEIFKIGGHHAWAENHNRLRAICLAAVAAVEGEKG